MATSARELKAVYRKRFKEALNSLSEAEVQAQSNIITQRALDLDAYRNARSISIFLSMPGQEISTRNIVLQAFRDGKKVYVPYIHSSKQSKTKTMDMLRLQDENDLNSLEPDAWGIPSLSAQTVDARENALGGVGCSESTSDPAYGSQSLDLIFMPAMAFDCARHRLGHGKGFYDRYLSKHKELAHINQRAPAVPYLVGLALQQQILPQGECLPVTELDWSVDRVISADA